MFDSQDDPGIVLVMSQNETVQAKVAIGGDLLPYRHNFDDYLKRFLRY